MIRLFVGATAEEIGNDYNPSQQLWLDAGENRGSHPLCTISVNVDCRDEFVRDCEKPLHGSSDLSRSQDPKTWLILVGKQFRSVTQPRDKRDTESRRSADNLVSLQTSSHSVYQAITFTSSLTECFDLLLLSQGSSFYP